MGKRGLFPTFRKALSTKLSEKLSMEILAKFTGCEKRLAEERGRKNRVNRAKITKLSDVHSEKITNKTITQQTKKGFPTLTSNQLKCKMPASSINITIMRIIDHHRNHHLNYLYQHHQHLIHFHFQHISVSISISPTNSNSISTSVTHHNTVGDKVCQF